MAGAPLGNKNSSKENRVVRDTLRKVAAQNPEKLRKACEALLDKAVDGDISAFTQFRDTLDGKPNQTVETTITRAGTADRVTDDVLADIATGSSTGVTEQTEGETPIH